jgi:malyl-CoA/(S)-citramalyl-CoA lyase
VILADARSRGREDQFRHAFLSRCVGAWSLHPAQIDIARRALFRSVEETRWARRVIERRGDRAGAVMVEGTLPDDASVKRCQVVANLAHQLAEREPDLAKLSATGYTTS